MIDLVFRGRQLTFNSPLSLEEATTRLQRELTPPTVAPWRQSMEYRIFEKRPQSFIGTLSDSRFHMVRLLRGRGSIRPWIDGTLSRAGNGCRVDVRVKMSTLGIIACVPVMVLGTLILAFASFFVVFMLPGLLMVLAPIVVASLEAGKATRMLAALFESEAKAAAISH